MFKRLVVILGGIVLSVQLLAVPDNAIFMSRLKVTGVQEFNPGAPIDSFTTYTSSGWNYLTAHTSGSSGGIIKDSLSGIILKGFNPGVPIDSFTANSDGEWAFLIAHAGGNLDTIIKTAWKGTWTQGYGSSGNIVKGFTADSSAGSGDSVWLMVTMGVLGIEESEERGEKSGRFVTGLNVISPNPCVAGNTTISYTIAKVSDVSLKIYDASGRLVKRLVDKEQRLGKYNLRWNGVDKSGRGVVAGTYFLRLEAGEVRTEKVVVIR